MVHRDVPAGKMGLTLYNTLSRSLVPFEPIAPPRVTFYMCGPTVWNYAHIGNFRTFLLGDLLHRYLEYLGYDVAMVMNLTDVDDRTIKAAAATARTLREHTEPFAQAFFEDSRYLRIRPADVYPRATEYIEQMVELAQQLIDRQLAYVGDDGSLYFAVTRFPTYGQLSQVDRRELKAGARVATDEYAKEDVRDFALWKRATEEDEAVGAAWDAPFGRGRPGWHLECSAMSLGEFAKFGVETLDLHAGGVDLAFPHHENEIAQSEGATGKPFVRCWVHGEFLSVHGTKMSKRFGNILTIRDLKEEGIEAAAVRTLMFSTHYRQRLNFTDDALRGASEAVRRLGEFAARLDEAAGPVSGAIPQSAQALERAFRAALDEDLNAPEALGAVFTFIRQANRSLDDRSWGPSEAAAAQGVFRRVMGVLDLVPSAPSLEGELATWVEERMAARQAARLAKDFGTADAIRDEIVERGIEIEDTPSGPRWRRRVT